MIPGLVTVPVFFLDKSNSSHYDALCKGKYSMDIQMRRGAALVCGLKSEWQKRRRGQNENYKGVAPDCRSDDIGGITFIWRRDDDVTVGFS